MSYRTVRGCISRVTEQQHCFKNCILTCSTPESEWDDVPDTFWEWGDVPDTFWRCCPNNGTPGWRVKKERSRAFPSELTQKLSHGHTQFKFHLFFFLHPQAQRAGCTLIKCYQPWPRAGRGFSHPCLKQVKKALKAYRIRKQKTFKISKRKM